MKPAITFNGKPIGESPLWPKDYIPVATSSNEAAEEEFKRVYSGVWINDEQAEDGATN